MKTQEEQEIIEKMMNLFMEAVNASGRVNVQSVTIDWENEVVRLGYNNDQVYNVSIAYDSPLCALKDVTYNFVGYLTR